MHQDTDLLTTAQMADYLGITTASLAQMRYHGTGPPFVKIGRLVRYRWGDVQAWLTTHTHTITED